MTSTQNSALWEVPAWASASENRSVCASEAPVAGVQDGLGEVGPDAEHDDLVGHGEREAEVGPGAAPANASTPLRSPRWIVVIVVPA